MSDSQIIGINNNKNKKNNERRKAKRRARKKAQKLKKKLEQEKLLKELSEETFEGQVKLPIEYLELSNNWEEISDSDSGSECSSDTYSFRDLVLIYLAKIINIK